MSKYPNRLSILREDRGISLDRLAAELGMSKSAVQKYNNGSVDMGTSALLAVADILMVQPEDLLRPDVPSRIVNRIAGVREAVGLSQDDLAERLNWPVWKVRAAELATRFPPGSAMPEIAAALDCPMSVLVFDLTAASTAAQNAAALVEGLSEDDRQAVFRHADALAQSPPGPARKNGKRA